jgi:hypothetical protein
MGRVGGPLKWLELQKPQANKVKMGHGGVDTFKWLELEKTLSEP